MPAFWRVASVVGCKIMFAPELDTISHWLISMQLNAMCIPTSEEEHAVSIVMAGPASPKVKLILPEMTLEDVPVPV